MSITLYIIVIILYETIGTYFTKFLFSFYSLVVKPGVTSSSCKVYFRLVVRTTYIVTLIYDGFRFTDLFKDNPCT